MKIKKPSWFVLHWPELVIIGLMTFCVIVSVLNHTYKQTSCDGKSGVLVYSLGQLVCVNEIVAPKP